MGNYENQTTKQTMAKIKSRRKDTPNLVSGLPSRALSHREVVNDAVVFIAGGCLAFPRRSPVRCEQRSSREQFVSAVSERDARGDSFASTRRQGRGSARSRRDQETSWHGR